MAGIDDQATLAAAAADLAPESGRRLDTVFRVGAGIFSILVMLIAWELFARSGKVTPFMLPPLSAVVARIYTDAAAGRLWLDLGLTLYRALAGFFIAACGGVAPRSDIPGRSGAPGRGCLATRSGALVS